MLLTVGAPTDNDPDHDSDPRLRVLVQRRRRSPRGLVLPGRFLRERETFAEAVAATLTEKVGLDIGDAEPRLIKMYDAPGRDGRAWTLSALHVLALPHDRLGEADGELLPLGADGRLADGRHLEFDHDDMLARAVRRMREHYETGPDPYRLLGDSFTLGQLRDLHEGVLGEPLLKDTFNRRMKQYLTEKLVKGEPVREAGTGGRPALVYKRAKDGELTDRERRRLLLPRR
ncbi:NUDIX hydrolase [Nocardioides sp. JQ2195]|uniref:NUDIX hydrolase n=1 Tax=Nocardioides sp. JQ2195 TaxID=2592334 RepID=UPI00143E23EE|nr:NUDIX hydrolase [Nocardioides sp. JQ2195]QIX27941.1 NUDIX hydrolase [Nocardioides sp. JQ2195]